MYLYWSFAWIMLQYPLRETLQYFQHILHKLLPLHVWDTSILALLKPSVYISSIKKIVILSTYITFYTRISKHFTRGVKDHYPHTSDGENSGTEDKQLASTHTSQWVKHQTGLLMPFPFPFHIYHLSKMIQEPCIFLRNSSLCLGCTQEIILWLNSPPIHTHITSQ